MECAARGGNFLRRASSGLLTSGRVDVRSPNDTKQANRCLCPGRTIYAPAFSSSPSRWHATCFCSATSSAAPLPTPLHCTVSTPPPSSSRSVDDPFGLQPSRLQAPASSCAPGFNASPAGHSMAFARVGGATSRRIGGPWRAHQASCGRVNSARAATQRQRPSAAIYGRPPVPFPVRPRLPLASPFQHPPAGRQASCFRSCTSVVHHGNNHRASRPDDARRVNVTVRTHASWRVRLYAYVHAATASGTAVFFKLGVAVAEDQRLTRCREVFSNTN